jgi:hypothetical protein
MLQIELTPEQVDAATSTLRAAAQQAAEKADCFGTEPIRRYALLLQHTFLKFLATSLKCANSDKSAQE